MADDSSAKQQAAPYLSFKTFLSALDALSHGVPPLIDRSIWKTQPGGIQGLIMGAFRFFELVDEENKPSSVLNMLATSKEDRPAALKTLLEDCYPTVFQHDVTKMSTKMLEDEMEHYGVTGETKKKAITFFLQAAKFCDLPLSPYLQSQIRATPGTRRKRVSTSRARENGYESDVTIPEIPSGSQGSTKTIQLHNGGTLSITVSVDVFAMSSDDRIFVFGLIDKLREYETKKSSLQTSADKEAK